MAYNYEYPYTDPNRYNDDWLLKKMQELDTDLKTLEERVKEAAVKASKEYVDERMVEIRADFETLQRNFNSLTNNFNNLSRDVQAQITILSSRIDAFRDEINADIIGVNARTDLAIQQNNEYIFANLEKSLARIKVTNFFTGLKISVQEMFDYLAMLHVDDALYYNVMAERAKTFDEFAALNISYTDLVLHGNSYYV